MVSIQGLRDMRMRALRAFYSVKPVRTTLMRAGLGTGRAG
jgi:2-octaprenyl-6-methoxyphenol hydroxylase